MPKKSSGNIFKKLLALGFLGILALISVGIFRNFLQKQMINKEVESLQQEIGQLEKGNKELTSLIDYLKTANFIESEARNKFGLAKSGEKVLVIAAGDSAVDKQSAIDATKSSKDTANPVKWWQYFWTTSNSLSQAPE